MIQRLRNRYNLSVSEVGYQDYWQRAQLGVAVVSYNGGGAERILQQVLDFVEREEQINVISYALEIY